MIRTALASLTLAATLAVPSASAAIFVDEFDDTSNVRPRNTNSTVAATAGRLVITRDVIGFTNYDYYEDAVSVNATGFSSLSNTFDLATQGTFVFEDVQPIDPDGEEDVFIAVRTFYFDASDGFLSEVVLQIDSFVSAGTDLTFDLSATAPSGATAYNILLTVGNNGFPDAEVGDGYSFESFQAVPEPATAALALGGLALMTGRRRCTRG